MALWQKTMLASLGVVGMGAASAVWLGFARWNSKTSERIEQLFHALPGNQQQAVHFEELEQLPVPVADYFRSTLRDGQPMIRSARIRQTGEFRAGGADAKWQPFEATQYFSAERPGFVWDAGIRMVPLAKVRVRDAYIAGKGSMQAKILAVVPVVDAQGKKELDAGALQRYLAEAAWFPTALLPSSGVQWSAIGHNSALATLSDAGITVSLEFHFNDLGEITRVFTSGRYREINGRYELTPWEGHFHRYQEKAGMRIPLEAEVAWQLRGVNVPYFKGRLVDVIYGFTR